MKFYLFLLVTSLHFVCYSQQKQICFTIDDLPVVNYGINDTTYLRDLTNRLTSVCRENNIPAIGFVNESKLYPQGQLSSFQVGLLQRWLDQGLDLGNHTYSHYDFNNVSFSTYTEDIVKGEIVTLEALKNTGRTLRYFRHPYLHTGATQSRADSLEQFLKARGYTIAPVTLDNEDYLFAAAYKRAQSKNNNALATRIGNDYVSYMEKKLLYYENMSSQLFGRNISHILLIHASLLNADYLDELTQMFRRNGYSFVTLETALQDDAYKTPISAFGKWGISWLDRWALSQGKKGEFFEGDPETPAYVKEVLK
jgi:peptidoglycan/xylan/chitin deacetylase (PgdA/CDA1 family)